MPAKRGSQGGLGSGCPSAVSRTFDVAIVTDIDNTESHIYYKRTKKANQQAQTEQKEAKTEVEVEFEADYETEAAIGCQHCQRLTVPLPLPLLQPSPPTPTKFIWL